MRLRTLCVTGLLLGALLATSATPAGAKAFQPGDVRICNARHCVPIMDQTLLNTLARFYYGGPAPSEARPPRLGAPYFQLQYTNGYVSGIAATGRFDRFRSGGVNVTQFGEDSWYRVPPRLAQGLRRLAAGLKPLRVTSSTFGPTRYG